MANAKNIDDVLKTLYKAFNTVANSSQVAEAEATGAWLDEESGPAFSALGTIGNAIVAAEHEKRESEPMKPRAKLGA